MSALVEVLFLHTILQMLWKSILEKISRDRKKSYEYENRNIQSNCSPRSLLSSTEMKQNNDV
jgi:hypothetical protein